MGRYNIGPQPLAYGTFWYNYDQSLSAANEPSWVFFDSSGPTNAVTLSATNTSRSKNIVIGRNGVYNIQFSAQVEKDTGSPGTIIMWFKQNGVNINATGGYMTLDKQQKDVLGFDVINAFSANDVLEIGWEVSDVSIFLTTLSADGTPSSPSIIVTVQQL